MFAFDAASGQLLWKTAVGIHNGHDDDDQLALDGTLHLQTPYTLEPGEVGGVETNMAAADGVVYVPVENLPETFATATARVGTSNFFQGKGEMVAIDIATGKPLCRLYPRARARISTGPWRSRSARTPNATTGPGPVTRRP